jgi:hypothetical protein
VLAECLQKLAEVSGLAISAVVKVKFNELSVSALIKKLAD